MMIGMTRNIIGIIGMTVMIMVIIRTIMIIMSNNDEQC